VTWRDTGHKGLLFRVTVRWRREGGRVWKCYPVEWRARGCRIWVGCRLWDRHWMATLQGCRGPH